MADATVITNTVLAFNTAKIMPTTAAVEATNGAFITCGAADHKMLIIMENSDAENDENVTIKKGNALQGTADLVYKVPKGETHTIVVESGKYKNISGTNKGKIHITGTADVKIACIVLP